MKQKHNSEIVDAVMNLISDAPTQIAEKTGVHKSTIYRIVNRQTDPPTSVIEKIMKTYNITWMRVLWRLTNPKGAINETNAN